MILIGDKGMDTPHLVWLCGALSGVCTFRDYFVAAPLVPLLRNGANRHPRLAVRSPLLYRSDAVLPLKAQPKKKRCKSILSGTTSSLRSSCRLRRGEPTSENNITFSPTLSFGCGSSPESATKEKEMQKCISFFLVHQRI